jgi:pyrroline-5-carboxylate reductase
MDVSLMRAGFVGTGTITSAIVTGMRADAGSAAPIALSPRNRDVAARLAARFPQVFVAASNQDVLDRSDVVFIAVRPQVAQDVLAALRFRSDHRVISLVATFSRDRIAALVQPAGSVTCAVPLPTVADRLGPTAICPPDSVAAAIFGKLGVAIEVATESEFQALWSSTAVMATFFLLLDTLCAWLTNHGVPPARARDYVATMFGGLGVVGRSASASFARLADEFATKGGLNEQCAAELARAGVFQACSAALDAVLARLQRGGSTAAADAAAGVADGRCGR